jgi:hypothetical protein
VPPRCACAFQSQRQLAVTALLDALGDHLALGSSSGEKRHTRLRFSDDAPSGPASLANFHGNPRSTPQQVLDVHQPGSGGGDADELRMIYCIDHLAERELCVYRRSGFDEVYAGSLMLSTDHKLADVVLLLRRDMKLEAVSIYRGNLTSELRVELHVGQNSQPCLAFFAHDDDYLVVVDDDAANVS